MKGIRYRVARDEAFARVGVLPRHLAVGRDRLLGDVGERVAAVGAVRVQHVTERLKLGLGLEGCVEVGDVDLGRVVKLAGEERLDRIDVLGAHDVRPELGRWAGHDAVARREGQCEGEETQERGDHSVDAKRAVEDAVVWIMSASPTMSAPGMLVELGL